MALCGERTETTKFSGWWNSDFHKRWRGWKEALSVGYSFRKPVRERKVREVRRRKTNKTERSKRSHRRRDSCQTGTGTGDIQHHLVSTVFLRDPRQPCKSVCVGQQKNAFDTSSGV